MRVLKHFLLCWFFLASMAFGQSVAHKELYDALHLEKIADILRREGICLLYTSPSPRDATLSRMPSSA